MKHSRTRHTSLSIRARPSSHPREPIHPMQDSQPSQPNQYSQPWKPSRSSQSIQPIQSSQYSQPSHTSNTCQPSVYRNTSHSITSRKPSRASQSSQPSRYNLSTVRVWRGPTPPGHLISLRMLVRITILVGLGFLVIHFIMASIG